MARLTSNRPGWLLAAVLMLPIFSACRDRAREAGEMEGEEIPDSPAMEAREGENVRARMEYFYRRRAFPFDRIPVGSLQRAEAQLRSRWPAAMRARAFLNAGAPGSWSSLGPRPISSGVSAVTGRVTAVAVHPTNPNILYVGGAQGGIWQSSDAGVTWTPRTDDQCSLAIGSLAIDPVNPSIIYAGTGEANLSADSYYGCGILRSIDGGTSWAQLGAAVFDTPTGGAFIASVVVDKANAGTAANSVVIVATNSGIWRSTNSGQSWTRVQTGYASALVQDPITTSTWYAGITFTNLTRGIYKSVDNGLTWNPAVTGFPFGDIGRIALAIAPSAPDTLYAAVQNDFDGSGADGGLLGVFKTTDGATSWSQLPAANATCATQCWYDIVLAVNPTNSEQVVFGGVQLFLSTDGGTSFVATGGGVHVDQHALVFADANTLYAGNDGGVYRASNFVWSNLNSDLALTQFYAGLSLAPGAILGVLGGSQDNGTLEYSGSASWNAVIGGDGGYTATDPQTAGVAYGETQWTPGAGFSGPRRRDAVSGGQFNLVIAGINGNDPGNFIPPLIMDPVDPRVLYFGTNVLYRTANRGDAWAVISPPAAQNGLVDAIGPASDGLTIYLASSGASSIDLEVSNNLGTTWQPASSGLPNRIVTDIQVDPVDPLRAYLVVSGFGTGHVFRTTSGGAGWQDISGNLPDVPLNSILWIPSRGELYLGSDLGVFTSGDQGTTWTPLVSGLPNVAVFDLVYDLASNTILAGTHGRGAFAYTLTTTGVLRGDISVDGQVTALDAQGILAATVGDTTLPYVPLPNGDASCDGKVSAFDAQLVLSFAVGLPTQQFCVGLIR